MNNRKAEFQAARSGLLRVFAADCVFTIDDVAQIIALAVSGSQTIPVSVPSPHGTPAEKRTEKIRDTPPAASRA